MNPIATKIALKIDGSNRFGLCDVVLLGQRAGKPVVFLSVDALEMADDLISELFSTRTSYDTESVWSDRFHEGWVTPRICYRQTIPQRRNGSQ